MEQGLCFCPLSRHQRRGPGKASDQGLPKDVGHWVSPICPRIPGRGILQKVPHWWKDDLLQLVPWQLGPCVPLTRTFLHEAGG